MPQGELLLLENLRLASKDPHVAKALAAWYGKIQLKHKNKTRYLRLR